MDQAQQLHLGPTDADEAREVWHACLEVIREKVNTQSFKTWFEPVQPLHLRAGKLTVQVPSQFFYDWLEEHYNSVISSTITNVLGKGAQLEYALGPEEPVTESDFGVSLPTPRTEFKEFPPQPDTFTTVQQPAPVISIGTEAPSFQTSLNPRYTFDKFIKGDSNQLARAAALAVANNPGGTSFNPLVIYGGVGLGKTHLIHSIGNYALSNGKAQRAIYVSSDRFTQEFIDAVARDRLNDFSNFYRSMDILIVDDIQFFSGKEKTQDSFFHTFNVLHQLGKQIVLSSDRPPKELKGLQDRLISRFQWGLTSDIQPPDLEMRIAILRKKSADDGIDLPEEVVEFIAANVTSNIRQMEGCLINLLAA
ncbi:MAG TPA: chromosomal replication initiator protein DnaA, partial [Bacteroidota bacterium]|nr:chromosomal replication initiator protein DnaA [Bacteroidota bacterium]